MRTPSPTAVSSERHAVWLSDADHVEHGGEDGGPSWCVSLTVCRVLDDEREEEHVEDVTEVVDGGACWHHDIADHVLAEHRRWQRTGRWVFDQRHGQWRAPVTQR